MALNNTPVAVTCAGVCAVGLLAGLAGQAMILGIAAVALIVTLAVLGLHTPGRTSWRTYGVLAAWGAAYCAVLLLCARLHQPAEPLATIGGFAAGTAILVYGATPLGLVIGVLYGLSFDREVLPLQKQEEFLRRFARD